jgi:putative ABC transport system permease protein
MFPLQRTLSLAYLTQHPTRMALVGATIALGVAILVATRSLDDSLHQAAKGAVNPFATLADLLVANGQTGVPADLADRLTDAHLPGLADVQPLVMGRATLVEMKDQSVRLIGIQLFPEESPTPDKALAGDNPWGLQYSPTNEPLAVGWSLLQGAKPVVVGAKLAEGMKDLPGGTHDFRLRRTIGADQKVTCLGTVRLVGQARGLEDEAVFADVRTASSIIYPQKPKTYATQLNLKLAPLADKERVRKEVEQFLKDQNEPAQVQTVEANEEMASDVTAGLELGFSVGSYLALMVGLFLVYIVLSVSVAERRHDVGVLRSLGATRAQIAGLFVGEAALLGLIGSLLGLPLGYGLAWLLLGPMHRVLSEVFVKLPETTVSLSVPAMLLAVGAGMATALLASLIPALQAADEQPADAVRRVPQTMRPLYFALQAGTALLLAATALGAAMFRPYLPARVGSFLPPICLMAAVLVSMPVLAAGVGWLLQPFFRFFLGLPGRLAADNLIRSPGRTGLVVAALAATGGLLLDTAGFTHSTEYAINDWLDNNIAAELYVTAGSGISKAGFSLPMDKSVGDELVAAADHVPPVEGVEAVLPVRSHYFTYKDQFTDKRQFVFLLAIGSDSLHGEAEGRALGGSLRGFPRFRERHTCVMSENFAALHHVAVGDHITIPGVTTPTIDLEVIGSIADYSYNRGTLLVDRNWYADEFADNQVDVFDVYLKKGADARQVQAELTKAGGWASRQAVFVERNDQLRDAIASQLQRIYYLAYAQEMVVGVVALLGVVLALFISVLQRRRELGLLRAVGASQGQVLQTVVAEAALMGLVGAVIGILVGLMLEWYTVKIMVFDEAGFIFPMLIPWKAMLIVFGGAVLSATLVGIWPAWLATRQSIPEAIAYE